jgi:hypothetical protein
MPDFLFGSVYRPRKGTIHRIFNPKRRWSSAGLNGVAFQDMLYLGLQSIQSTGPTLLCPRFTVTAVTLRTQLVSRIFSKGASGEFMGAEERP